MAGDAVTKMLTLVMRVQDDASAQLTRIQKVTKLFGGTVHKTTGQLQRFTHRFMQVARALVSFLIMRTVTVQFVKFFKELLRGNEILERATTSISRLVGSLGAAQKKIDYIRATAMRAPFDFESILQSSVLLTAFGKDIEKFLPRLLDWAAGMNMTSGELVGYASAMGKILAQSPHVLRLLQSRGIGLEQWKQALAEVNQELPQAQRFEEALFLVTKRFEGQAAALAKTLYGLKTNIHDVWVEMQREIGLSMFIKVRAALFGLYSDMRNLVDNQREMLWDIGDAIGSWVGNLIMFIKELHHLAGPLKAILKTVKYLAVFLIGRSLIAALMNAVQWVVMLATNFSLASLAAGGIAVAVGLIVVQLAKAKMKALELQQEFDQWAATIKLLEEFRSRDEKIFTRSERHFIDDQLEALRETLGLLRQDVELDWSGGGVEMVESLERVLELTGKAKGLFGDEETALVYMSLMDRMEQNKEKWQMAGMTPEAQEGLQSFRNDLAWVLEALVEFGDRQVTISEALKATADAQKLVKTTEVAALARINTALEMWKQGQGGVAEYADVTLQHVLDTVAAEREHILSLAGTGELMRIELGIAEDLLKVEKDRLQFIDERYSAVAGMLDQTQAVAEAEFALGGSAQDLLATYREIMGVLEQQMMMPGADPERIDELLVRMYELLQLYRDLAIATEEIAAAEEKVARAREQSEFEAWAKKWQQALAPIGSAIAQMAFDLKNIGKYAAQAFKQMIMYAIRLAVQYAILAILRAIWDPTAIPRGGEAVVQTLSFTSAVAGGLVPAADGYRGMVNHPTLFLAGEEGPEYVDITPQGGGRRGSGGGGITVMGDVYGWDDFVDKVQSANSDIALATGGEG